LPDGNRAEHQIRIFTLAQQAQIKYSETQRHSLDLLSLIDHGNVMHKFIQVFRSNRVVIQASDQLNVGRTYGTRSND